MVRESCRIGIFGFEKGEDGQEFEEVARPAVEEDERCCGGRGGEEAGEVDCEKPGRGGYRGSEVWEGVDVGFGILPGCGVNRMVKL